MTLPARNSKKPRQHGTFRSRGASEHRRPACKTLTQRADLQFCNNRAATQNAPEQIKPRLSNSRPTQSPWLRMSDNPFIKHQFLCPSFKGNPRGARAEQIKSSGADARSAAEYLHLQFYVST